MKRSTIALIGLFPVAGFLLWLGKGEHYRALGPEPPQLEASPRSAGTTAPSSLEAKPTERRSLPAPQAPSATDKDDDKIAGKTVDVTHEGTSPTDMRSPYLGPKDAPVVVNVFSDFQCPVCKRSADPIKQLVQDFPGKVKVIYRNDALPMHGRSRPAALAAWAAKKQGRFWEYYDLLFSQQRLDDASLEGYAQQLGLNMDQWRKDVADPQNAARIEEEASWAKRLGATGTPSVFVNGRRTVGWGSYMGLKDEVRRELTVQQGRPASPTDRIAAAAGNNTAIDPGTPRIDPILWAKLLTHD